MIPVVLLFPSDICPEQPPPKPCINSISTSSSETTFLLSSSPEPKVSTLYTTFEALKSNLRHNIEHFTGILHTSPLSRPTIVSFFLLALVHGIRVIFTQWASVTYHWIIADVQALSSFEMIVSGTTLLSLPILTKRYLHTHLGSSSSVDMFVSKFSLPFLSSD
jgi:hypothetical protein